jgi:putative addiction module killer protein
MFEIVRYARPDGSEPFTEWLRALKDGAAKAAIAMRLRRIEQENLGDCKAVGEGVSELRIHVGPGYRVYFGQYRALLVILLCGGDKGSQAKDIVDAKALWAEWKRRQP